MGRIGLMIALISAVAVVPAFGQAPFVPAPPYYAMEPTMPLTPYAKSPVQQQILENYRSQLLQTQREQLEQNPSGLGREQLEVGRQLNAYGPGYSLAPPAMGNPGPAPSFNPAPFSSANPLPSPPFDAAPVPSYPSR